MLCNSCNANFSEESSRNTHYRSDWHRYNLKRKVAGLPGVTEEWFEARKSAAAAAAAAVALPHAGKGSSLRLNCALCSKQYGSAKALENHLKSRGHAARIAAAPAGTQEVPAGTQGMPAGAPTVPTTVTDPAFASSGDVLPSGSALLSHAIDDSCTNMNRATSGAGVGGQNGEGDEHMKTEEEEDEGGVDEQDEGDEEDEEWEEVEDDEEAAALLKESIDVTIPAVQNKLATKAVSLKSESVAWEAAGRGRGSGGGAEEDWEWDCATCLFCDRMFGADVAECVSHMHREHGFFLPDAEYISDLSGMLTYLALKIHKGLVCLYCDDRGKAYPSAEAVKAHMIAKCHAKLRYGDGSGAAEEELVEFYDFSPSYDSAQEDQQLVALDGESAQGGRLSLLPGGSELVIRDADEGDGAGSRVLGSREFARYYKQRPKPGDSRSRLLQAVVSTYKSMGLKTKGLSDFKTHKELAKRDTAVKASQRAESFRTRVGLANNAIRNLPKNCVH